MLLRLRPVLRQLDAAGLAAASDLHLRLDDAGVSNLVSGVDSFVHRARRTTGRHGHAVAGKELFSLIFE